jgi:hypothetical protein
MLQPWEPSPCCRDKDGRLMGTDPSTQERTWDPVKRRGLLFCSVCHRIIYPQSQSQDPQPNQGGQQ